MVIKMSLAKKLIYPKSFKRVIPVLLLAIAVATITMGVVFDAAMKSVSLVVVDEVNDINDEKQYNTRKTTVAEFFEEKQIEIGENDIVNKDNEEEIFDDDIIIIRKGRKVELSADGKVEFAITTRKTVGDALSELGVELAGEDVVTPASEEIISDGMSITVDRYITETVTETKAIAFETKKINKSSMKSGTTKVVTEGEEGKREITYTVKKKNGEEISREVVSDTVVKEPVTKVIHVGTKKVTAEAKAKSSAGSTASNGGKKAGFSYSKKFDVTATAYSASLAENGGNTKTAYGLTPKYGVVAVDPRVIPLGTKLYIESSDGGKSWVYGYCIAGDTGGAIKGKKVDLCFSTSAECRRFGRKSATVYILN